MTKNVRFHYFTIYIVVKNKRQFLPTQAISFISFSYLMVLPCRASLYLHPARFLNHQFGALLSTTKNASKLNSPSSQLVVAGTHYSNSNKEYHYRDNNETRWANNNEKCKWQINDKNGKRLGNLICIQNKNWCWIVMRGWTMTMASAPRLLLLDAFTLVELRRGGSVEERVHVANVSRQHNEWEVC